VILQDPKIFLLLLKKLGGNNITNKKYDELKNAIEDNYVRKFWIASRG